MCIQRWLCSLNLIYFLTITFYDSQVKSLQIRNEAHVRNVNNNSALNGPINVSLEFPNTKIRVRRDEFGSNSDEDNEDKSSFLKDELGWSSINEEVDMVIPMVLKHLQKLGIEHLQLPPMKETISVNPLFITYEVGLFLTNGVVYNIDGIKRYENAVMTYEGKSFLSRFNIIIKYLQFEYDFLVKFMAIEGYGKVIGALDDTIIYAELAVNVSNLKLKLIDFHIVEFRKIHVQLDQIRLVRELSGAILTPITNLFKDRITTSISDGLKGQMQTLMDDFNNEDPLQLQQFTKQLLSGLTGQPEVKVT